MASDSPTLLPHTRGGAMYLAARSPAMAPERVEFHGRKGGRRYVSRGYDQNKLVKREIAIEKAR